MPRVEARVSIDVSRRISEDDYTTTTELLQVLLEDIETGGIHTDTPQDVLSGIEIEKVEYDP